MNYLTYLDIKQFKSIENVELEDLSNVNIILGANNSGKTSLLEAISILGNQNSVRSILNNTSKRGNRYQSNFELFLDIFPMNQKYSKSIEIVSEINKTTRELRISGALIDSNDKTKESVFWGKVNLKEQGKLLLDKDLILNEGKNIRYIKDYDVIKIVYVTPSDYFREDLIEDSLSNIDNCDKERIINVLKIIDNNILDFEVVKLFNNNKRIVINHSIYGKVPMFSFGDGIKKVFTLASAVVSAEGGILLIDEIETAIHKNKLSKIIKWVIETANEYKVQIICTTHSLEAIDSIILSMINETNLLSCFRIEIHDNQTYYTKLPGDKLKNIRASLGQDVR